jgi:hypothetical protein
MSEELRKTVMDILDYGIARVEIRKPNNSGGIFPIWGKEVIDHAENAIEALIQAERIKAKQEALAETLYVISGIGSRGDKVNGNSKFMSGVMAAEDYIQIMLAELDTPKASE